MENENAPLMQGVPSQTTDNRTYSSFQPLSGEEIIIETQGTDGSTHRLRLSNDEKPLKTIGMFGSFVLLVNNLTGPGMLGFPNLFQKAGILPVLGGITFVFISASLCGTFLADSIASIPNNHNFDLQVDFSSAFRYTVGEDWYVVAETLFLISCFVQAIAGIVETAQSLDGFIASFLIGKTYAFEFYPRFQVISWSPELCHEETEMSEESNLEDCTPFHNAGTLVLTLGFLITTLMFLPLGRGHLKETIIVQIISFVFMLILLFQFSGEFMNRGLDYKLPWVGNEVSQLAGVILFNYAFSITIPAWLSEKSNKVSVNKVVWTSSILASAIYVVFGIMGAMAFAQVGPNILILLTSSKVHFVTRLCAALFGVMIIGCGVPVFCVIIKNALHNNEVCSAPWAMFFGAFLPYLFSWTLYQGTLLMSMLNWTGLVVNGLVAFLLPMVLALKTTELRNRRAKSVELVVHAEPNTIPTVHEVPITSPEHDEQQNSETDRLISVTRERSSSLSERRRRIQYLEIENNQPTHLNESKAVDVAQKDSARKSNDETTVITNPRDRSESLEEGGYRHYLQTRLISNTTVQPLPYWLEYYRREIVLFMIIAFASIIVLTILDDAIEGIAPPDADVE